MDDFAVFEARNFALQSGGQLPVAKLAYATQGTLSPAGDNVVLIPSWYSGTHRESALCLVGDGRAIDPAKHFVVTTNLLSNGVSSSPSNTPAPFEATRFPRTTLHDNVRLQHMMLTEVLGVERIKLVAGWSMGGCQAYQWGVQYPDMMQAIAPLNCSARTGNYNKVFLLALRRALELDPVFNDGFYTRPPLRGLHAFAAIYAGWGFSEPFFRTEAYRQFGADSSESFIERFWEPAFQHHDANDLLALLQTWFEGDISANAVHNGDYAKALSSIKARAMVMPGEHDRYFPPVDSFAEVSHMPNAVCRPIPSIWGHMTVWNDEDRQFIDAGLREVMAG
ncbi:alpha/beta fold hydrolase [Beijerinckia sp. L45]|uniref:alpha/beta fold hydrolase n=1 Tax=Beijerinckia sp. L45 TaxID=1641855 RepID=UPI00131AB851|nr:alpha/beta fold hydrolase [Beijerinckia sp. L45]